MAHLNITLHETSADDIKARTAYGSTGDQCDIDLGPVSIFVHHRGADPVASLALVDAIIAAAEQHRPWLEQEIAVQSARAEHQAALAVNEDRAEQNAQPFGTARVPA